MTLKEQLAQALADAKAALEAGDLDKGRELRVKAESLKAALDELATLEGIKIPATQPIRPGLPGVGAGNMPGLPAKSNMTDGGDEAGQATKLFDALYEMRYGEDDAAMKAVYGDLMGPDYRQMIFEQNKAFARYLRGGESELSRDDVKLLKRQIFPADQVRKMIENGYDVATIKTTMVEAQGTLGGYAVPPNVQADVAMRLPGLSVVRGGGATVIDLMAGNSVDVPVVTGGDARYPGALRGVWGSETTTPEAKNATLGMVPVVAHVYTYKVGMSQSLVEDAANLVSIVTNQIVQTLAIDEDEADLVGDGANKPRGILPGSTNADSLTEVVSGHATLLTGDGMVGLSDVLDVQYDDRAIYVFAKATGTAIRKLKTGSGEYLFDRDLENNKRTLIGSPFVRSEAMPAIGAGTYPIIRGDFSGYWIVQKAGLTIARYQDSNTGPNKVEYHVRRRVGGRTVETWKFGVQKVAAS